MKHFEGIQNFWRLGYALSHVEFVCSVSWVQVQVQPGTAIAIYMWFYICISDAVFSMAIVVL